MSTRSLGQKFTTQGLGDRFDLVSLAYRISRMEKRLTAVHLATNHTQDYKLNSIRALDPSVRINYFGKNITSLEMSYIRLRYNCPKVTRIAHRIKNLKIGGK